jgi:hypothetical protein
MRFSTSGHQNSFDTRIKDTEKPNIKMVKIKENNRGGGY